MAIRAPDGANKYLMSVEGDSLTFLIRREQKYFDTGQMSSDIKELLLGGGKVQEVPPERQICNQCKLLS